MTPRGTLSGGLSSEGNWINEYGEIAGQSQNGQTDPLLGLPASAVLWKRTGEIVDLGTLGGNEGSAAAVNNLRQVIGRAANSTRDSFPGPLGFWGTQTRAFLWEKGVMKNLGDLGGPDSFATFINLPTGAPVSLANSSSVKNCDMSISAESCVKTSGSHSSETCPARLSAIARPFARSSVSRSRSMRWTATSFVPSVCTTRMSSRPMPPAFSTVLFPAMIFPFLSKRIDRPAPKFRRLFSIICWPRSVPLLAFLPSGTRSETFFVKTWLFPILFNSGAEKLDRHAVGGGLTHRNRDRPPALLLLPPLAPSSERELKGFMARLSSERDYEAWRCVGRKA